MHLKNLTNTQKGLALIAAGIACLLLIGFFKEVVHYIILIGSVALIGYGIILGDLWSKTVKFINNLRHKK